MYGKWLAKYTNVKTGKTNFYILTDEPLDFRDEVIYVEMCDETEVIDPKRPQGVDDAIPRKCIWLYDNNKSYDTLRRVYISEIM